MIGILGAIHSDEMREEFNYSLERMKEIIDDFKPDIICGEVRLSDYTKYLDDESYNGYLGPNEYGRLILPYCKERNVMFVPIDHYEDESVGISYEDNKSMEEIAAFEKSFKKIMEEYLSYGHSSKLAFNSLRFNDFIRNKQLLQKLFNEDVHQVYWEQRNKDMVQNITNTIKNNPDARILCIAGAEHSYWFCDELQQLNHNVIYPLVKEK